MFILQLCRIMDRKLTNLLSQRRSYYAQRVLSEFASNLLIIENPKAYLPNYQEYQLMKEMYSAWNIDELVSNLKNKYELSLTNYRFFLEYDEKRQNALTTLLLGSITIFSINQTIPILYQSFGIDSHHGMISERIILVIFTFIAVIVALYTFLKYYMLEGLDKLLFKLKNRKLRKQIEK